MAILTAVAISIGGLVEIIPMFSAKLGPEHLAGVTPLTPLEAAGRDIYIREGCFTCHSQMIRPTRAEMLRYGEWTRAGEYEYDHPFLLGSRRIGPDLQRVGGKYPGRLALPAHEGPAQHVARAASCRPIPGCTARRSIRSRWRPRCARCARSACPTTTRPSPAIPQQMQAEGSAIVASLKTGGFTAEPDEEIVALIAYLQRLGKDGTAAIKAGATKAAVP